MKFIVRIVIISIIGVSCSSPSALFSSIHSYDTGRCFTIVSTDEGNNTQNISDNHIIRIVEPKFKKRKITLSVQEINKYECGDDLYQVPITDEYYIYRFYEEGVQCLMDGQNTVIQICKIAVPVEYICVTKSKLEQSEFKIEYSELIKESKLVEDYNRSKQKNLKENEILVKKGNYYSPREILHLCDDVEEDLVVLNIQNKLIDLGYEIEANNKFDIETRYALFHFQKANNLDVGRIDFKTLKMLKLK